ncbi:MULTISPECIES: glycosyltransferase [Microbacterium]|uniref:D-inositol 3-phosphate glycosyltransferase n=1 Tax=Microbacterium wangchenii TaxID=2541726 RepID=A0ABX5SZ32_9MICO|nr:MULTISPECIES: glycosyltransferase [Microbacterium]MCK6066100.1 glycosyltransferase [Microbacterium sp. EYE_512]QBR90382.1 glycosyltransferase [Microbacterium wangchenii]TXK11602.1 glycosyltransferase family 4 protein [Microbacterium wangchenii]
MHVVMFGDQHVESSGGAQVSMRLQRRFLERAGQTVTIVAPRMHARATPDAAYVDLPSIPVTLDREYSMSLPGARTDRFVDAAMSRRPPVDVVHVQADFWGALIGHRFARRHGLPVVHTMHNRVDVGIAAVAPFPGLVLRVLNAGARRVLGVSSRAAGSGSDGWSYLRLLAGGVDAVTAPSGHFARRLEAHGVHPAVDVVWNGIDDDVLDSASAAPADGRAPGPPRLVWVGRMSAEKRLLPFLEGLAESGVAADVEVIGGGGQARAARRLVRRRRPAASVVFTGRLPYPETLRRIAAADAVVQTSIGFETQGMTVFEAAALGTPAVVSDPDIAAELGSGAWTVADASTTALAATLRQAADDITAGTAPVPESRIRELFRQSSRTAAMVDVYQRAIAGRSVSSG